MKTLGWLTVLAGVVVGVVGLFVLVIHVVVWLKTGDWGLLGIGALWGGGDLQTDWAGLNKLAHYFRNFPVGMLIVLSGIGVVHVGIRVVDYADR